MATSEPRRVQRPFRVLIVDHEPDQTGKQVERYIRAKRDVEVRTARTLHDARRQLTRRPIDLAIIEPNLPDGSGFDLARTLRSRRRPVQTLIVADAPDLDAAMQAVRVGAIDFLTKPIDMRQFHRGLREAIARHERDAHQTHRIRRLRRACHKLNRARQEISQQVDMLCNDLVTAYQELAEQVQQTTSAGEYRSAVEGELDLEKLLRKTLEYLVEHAGPTNAVLFLPASADEFSVGGYVNFDCTKEAADLLLQHLGDVFAPCIAAQPDVVRLNTDDKLKQCIGDDAAYLAECDVVAFACHHNDEPLAVITLFRDRDTPFDDELVQVCRSVAPIMGETLSRLIRVHHRQIFIDD